MGIWSVTVLVSFHMASNSFSCSAKPPFLINILFKKNRRVRFHKYFLNSGRNSKCSFYIGKFMSDFRQQKGQHPCTEGPLGASFL